MKRRIFLFVAGLMSASALCGPKVSILGDSYSTFEGAIPKGNATWYCNPTNNLNDVTRASECWWAQVISNINGRLERNESWSGSTVCNTGYDKDDVTGWSFLARLGRLGDPDIILVCGGTNDSWAKVPIGEFKYGKWTVEDLFCFRPAMAKMLVELKTGYPKADVYFILNDSLSDAVNGSVHAICAHYKVPCIDLVKIDKQRNHPSVAGMRSIAEQVTAVIREMTHKN